MSINQIHHLPFVAILLACVVSVAGYAQEPASQPEQDGEIVTSVSVEDVIDDNAIARRLRAILGTRERFSEVDISVDSGVVTFSGQAETDEDRLWAEKLAERTEGVVVVDNMIEVDASVNIEENLNVVQTSLMALWRDFLKRLPLMIVAIIVLVITAMVAQLLGRLLTRLLMKRQRIRGSLKDLINQLATITVWVIGLMIAAVIIFPGMTPAKALTVLGLGSVAIGFAFKDIFENFFAGILILWRYPFDRGDFISCDDLTGQVEQITVRNTLIRQLDGELTVVPNAHLFKSKVDVLNDRNTRRVRLTCGVAYDEDVAKARQVIETAVSKCKTVNKNQPVEVFAKEFADSSVNFEVAWWTDPRPTAIRKSRDEVVESIKSGLDDSGIEIPFPYRTLTFKRPEDACLLLQGEGS